MRSSRIALFFFLIFLPAGCATMIPTEPTSGMGSTAQKGIAAALDHNLALETDLVEGKKVSVSVETLGEVSLSSAIRAYARSVLVEEVETAGGEVVPRGEISITAKIDAAGIAAFSRSFRLRSGGNFSIPLWYSETTKGESHVILVYQDAEGNPLRTIVNRKDVPHRDIYLFYFFGLSETP